MTCGTCRRWGRPPGPEPRRFGYCFAKKALGPLWLHTLYPIGDGTMRSLLQSPLMPDTDGEGCDAYRARP